jgi:F-type H+-transporting ATPase subunit epsilon
MSYSPFTVTVTNVSGALFDGSATLLTVPTVMGDATILAHHEPLIALLKEGIITVLTNDGKKETFMIVTGILEVSNNHATVLV